MVIDLSKFIIIDHHAHSLLKGHLQLDAIAFRQCFSESRSISLLQDHIASSVFYVDILNRLGQLLGVVAEEGLLEYRAKQPEGGYINRLWDDVSIGALIIDDGYRATEMLGLNQLSELSGRPIYCCRRIETVLEDAVTRAASFTELSALFQKSLLEMSAPRVVALKTICAYRGGLDIELASADQARNDFDRVKGLLKSAAGTRIVRSPLYHYFLLQSFEMAAASGLPVQVHAGIGDDDADLRQSNPLFFRPVLHSQTYARTNFIFLHCYPFVAESAFLSALYPNVFLDLSLSISLASPIAEQMIVQALAQAPSTKLLAGTDGHSIPEAHWYAALTWRRALQNALRTLNASGFVSELQAYDIAAAVLHDNARHLYVLDGLA